MVPCGQQDPLQHQDRCDSLGSTVHLQAPTRPGFLHKCPGLQHRATQEAEGIPTCPHWGPETPSPLHPFMRWENKDLEQVAPPQMCQAHHNLKILMPPAPSYGAFLKVMAGDTG